MHKQRKDDHFVKKPIYPGGLKAMRQLIKDNLRYPAAALAEKVEGRVYLRYGIDYQGNVSEVKILQSLGHGCDEEAIRIVKLFKFKVPKVPRKMKVAFHKTLRINFKLPKKKAAPEPAKQDTTTYSYTITTKKLEPKAPSTSNSSYTYTINIG